MEKKLPYHTSHEMNLYQSSVIESLNCKSLDARVFKCSFCELTFLTNKLLQRHELLHKNRKIFSCSECQYKCHRKQYLNHHMLSHSKEKNFLCSICGETFTFHETLKNHVISKHPTEKPFLCNFCSFQTSGAQTLKQHMVKHINHFMSCSLCSYSCCSEADLKKHRATHAADNSKLCDTCNLTFPTSVDLEAHKFSHVTHNQQNYKCTICPFASLIQTVYVRHMSTHNVSKPFICDICDYSSDRRMNLKMHMKRQHKLTLPSVVRFSCVHCSFTCERNQDFTKHMLTKHSIEKPFTCLLCPFSTHRQSLLNVHLETHKPHAFTCQFCNFKSKRKTLLKKHLTSKHAEESCPDESNLPALNKRLFTCKFCHFKSHHYASLRNHLPMHSDVRFPCSECSYVTYSRRNLASHSKSHMKDKPYKCQFCSYTSARIGNFKMHMVTHVNEKKYYCSKCTFVCLHQRELADHMSFVHDISDKLKEYSNNYISKLSYQSIVEEIHVPMENNQNSAKEVHLQMEDNQISAEEVPIHTDDNQISAKEVHVHTVDNLNSAEEVTVHSEDIKGSNDNVHQAAKFPFVIFTKNSIHLSSSAPTQTMISKELSAVENWRNSKPENRELTGGLLIPETNTEEGPSINSKNTVITNTEEGHSEHGLEHVCNQDNIINCKNTNSTSGELYSSLTLNQSNFLKVATWEEKCKPTKPTHHVEDTTEGINTSNSKPNLSLNKTISDVQNTFVFHGECSGGALNAASNGEIQQVICKLCKTSWKSDTELMMHVQVHARDTDKPVYYRMPTQQKTVSSQQDNKLYSCWECGFHTQSPSDFSRHMGSSHNIQKPFSCKLCKYTSKRAADLKIHKVTHDNGMIRSCGLCDYTCKRVPALRKHMRKHADVTLFSCGLCGFGCNFEPDLKSHMVRAHEKNKYLTCRLCLSSFQFAVHYKNHMSSKHAIENAFLCLHCEYSTNQWNNFRAHKLKHTSKQRQRCTLLDMELSKTLELKLHFKTISEFDNPQKTQNQKCKIEGLFICKFCQQKYKHASSLCKHISLVHKATAKKHYCSLCSYKTTNLALLKRHLQTHGIGKWFQCTLCQFGCNHKEILNNHLLLHNDKINLHDSNQLETVLNKSNDMQHQTQMECSRNMRSFRSSAFNVDFSRHNCTVCHHRFRNASSFKKHLLDHKNSQNLNQLQCSVCSFKCLRPHELKLHTFTHTGETPYSCSECDFQCGKPYTLKYHKQKHHSLCLFECRSKLHLQQHLQVKHSDNHQQGTHSDDLQPVKHSDDLHPINYSLSASKVSTSTEPVSCKPTAYNLERFAGAKNNNRNFSQRSKSTRQLVKPIISPQECGGNNTPFVNSRQLFLCNECDYSTTHKGNLTSHLEKHALKSFLCHLCNYSCRREKELKRHLLSHEFSKPLSCDLCSYSCIHRSSLRVHMLKHTGKKPVGCKVCDFRCRQASTLRDHMMRHSDERKFICDQCGHQAKRAIALKIHLLTHSSEKLVACPLCDFMCKHKNSLRSHLISHETEHVRT